MKEEALRYLKAPSITQRIIKDIGALGYVGEEDNKFLGYLIAISRKLNEPLSGIVVSGTASGKSRLVDTIQLLTPKEDVIFTSRLTPQALYYMPKDFLRHKLLIVEERFGSELADYSIRTLQSKGRLSLAVPVKSQTVFFTVEGPVSILETTTSYKLNLENTSRCFILHLDESQGQTELIHIHQRLLKTQEGIQARKKIQDIIKLHHNVQSLLKPLPVIIPYAKELSFPAHTPSLRREHQKFLTLIEAVALLHQHQRRIKDGCIISTSFDYKIAHDLFKKAYHNNIITSHPKAQVLLNRISHIKKPSFTRADIARYTGWPAYSVRDNIKYLEEAGILHIIQKHRGKEALYSLNTSINLTKPEELKEKHSSTS